MVSVLFKLSGHEEPTVPYVSIRPTDTRWNDFSHNYHALVRIKLEVEGPTLELRALVVPIESFDGNVLALASYFEAWLRKQTSKPDQKWIDSQVDLESQPFPRFISLLQGEDAYKKLAVFVRDRDIRSEILTKINDLVILRETKSYEALTNILMRASEFQLGVMRTGSAFRALHRGRRYLFGNFAPPAITDARSSFRFECPLHGFQGVSHSLSAKFVDNEIISDRIHCLVGRNGAGKSRLLRELVLNYGSRVAEIEGATPFLDNFDSTARNPAVYGGNDYTRVIVISSDSESSFPSAVRSDSRFEYYLANLHRKEHTEGGTNVSTRLLVDLMRGSDDIGEKPRWQIFQRALRGYIEISDLHLPLLDDANHGRAIAINGQKWANAAGLKSMGEQASLELYAMLDLSREVCFVRDDKEVQPSSGERMYFRFALNLLNYIDIASVLIIDEPETHLHPNLVCDFINLLYEVLSDTKSIALIATHSAYVVREVPTHCAHIYSIDDDKVPSERFAYLKTLGASIESISQAIFADSNARKFHRQIASSMASEGRTLDELIESYASFVSPELLSQVANMLEKKNSAASTQ